MPFTAQIERIKNQPAYILHRRPFRNSSLILDVFSRDYGRLSLVAKGAMSQKSRLKGLLQAFQPMTLSWVRKGEMGTLANAESIAPPYYFSSENLFSALYVNEILMKLIVKDDPCPELFDIYISTLTELKSIDNFEASLRLFEKELLQTIGYEIDLLNEADTQQPITNEGKYKLIPDHGFVKAQDSENNGLVFQGKHLIQFANNNLHDSQTKKTARILMQLCLKRLLGENELKSRELYKEFVKTKSQS